MTPMPSLYMREYMSKYALSVLSEYALYQIRRGRLGTPSPRKLCLWQLPSFWQSPLAQARHLFLPRNRFLAHILDTDSRLLRQVGAHPERPTRTWSRVARKEMQGEGDKWGVEGR